MEEEKLLHVLRLFCLLIITSSANASDTKLYVFVSNSMGKELLKDYIHEAEIHGATLVFVGLVKGSFRAIGNLVAEIIGKKNVPIIIDDELFKKYAIKEVPSFVLLEESSGKYDKILGNISLSSALEAFAERGEVLR